MNILIFGDIIGRPGRKTMQKALPDLCKKHQDDLVIANVENLAHGFGITDDTIAEMRQAGINFFTTGNHIWKNEKGKKLLAQNPADIICPANVTGNLPGKKMAVITVKKIKILLINLLGQVFMETKEEKIVSPFETFDQIYQENGQDALVIVDLHAEATGEKRAFSWYVDGRADIVVGTHTHVQTTDEQIMPKGTAYITDLGMVGAADSSLGMEKERVLAKVALKKETHLEPPTHAKAGVLSGILVVVDEKKKKVKSIQRLLQNYELTNA